VSAATTRAGFDDISTISCSFAAKWSFKARHEVGVAKPQTRLDNYGNLVRARPFEGAPDDDELLLLARYLPTLAMAENVRRIEKRGWWQTLDRDVDSGEFD